MVPTSQPRQTFAWSLDGTDAHRILMVLVAAFLASILGQAAFAGTTRAAGYDAVEDPNSMYSITQRIGAQAWWQAGFTGSGVDVALIDTGCTPVPGLDAAGKVIYGPDLSLESQAPNLTNLDTNGHGTFMAGLIAANDGGTGAVPDPAVYRGVAPDARVVCIKVGTADGGTDVSQVIAAIDWVVQHRSDNGLNIRILNLSYGTNSTQSALVDPLAYAAEQAWLHGIFVVAAAGNSGYQRGRGSPGLASPAYDPYLMAVGATTYDMIGNYDNKPRISVAPFSASASGAGDARNPEIVAPGAHVQGLRVLGSYVDLAETPTIIDQRFQRGSGTSEAAAITSGAAALILQKYPSLSPDDLKAFFRAGAVKISGESTSSQGAGRLRMSTLLDRDPVSAPQILPNAIGIGSLEVSRGSDHLTHDGVVLQGEIDIFGHEFNSAAMAALEAAGVAWAGGTWNGNSWSGNSWSGNSWSGNSWSGNSWSGNSWSGNSWSGNSWSGNSWSGNSWSGNSWSGNSWSGNSWSGNSWSGNSWSGSSWSSEGWS